MSDYIDRAEAQTAIQFVAKRYTVAHEAHGNGRVVWSDILIALTDAMNALRDVPSAQPERKKGKWIHDPDPDAGLGWYTCSERGHNGYEDPDFCPDCGARMENAGKYER